MKQYVVDSNFFIQAHRATYPLDVALSFWTKIRQLADNEIIISIDKVKNEIYNSNDALEKWCKANLPPNFFKDSSISIAEYAKISSWAVSKSSHYTPQAINEFLDADEADAFLVSYALNDVNNKVLITHEISQPESKKRIKIPEPCDAFGIKYMNTIEMFRELKETF